MAHFRFRRSFGDVGTRRFRGARPLGSTPTFSPEALDYFSRLDTAGDTTYTAYKQPLANYIDSLVALGGAYWDDMGSAASFVGVGIEGVTVPLKSTMPTLTNNNFVAGDLDQLTGLEADAATKYINTNLNNNVNGQDNQSMSVWISSYNTAATNGIMGTGSNTPGTTTIGINSANTDFYRNRSSIVDTGTGGATGFVGMGRGNSANYDIRIGGTTTNKTRVSQTPIAGDIYVFARNDGGTADIIADARLATYHAGPALNLATLEGLQATLISEIAAI